MDRHYRIVNRVLNINPEFINTSTESSIKKTTSLLKKLRAIRSNNYKEILNDIEHLKLDMYLLEIIENMLLNLSENISIFFFDIIQLLHRKYQVFHQSLFQEVKLRLLSSIQHSDNQKFCEIYSLCILIAELHMLGILKDGGMLISSIEKLLSEHHGYDLHLNCIVQFLSDYIGFLSDDSDDELFGFDLKKTIICMFVNYGDSFRKHCLRKTRQVNNSLSHWRKMFENRGLSPENEKEIVNINHNFNNLTKSIDKFSSLLRLEKPELKIDNENVFEFDSRGNVIFLSNSKSESPRREAFNSEEKTFYLLDLQGFDLSDEIFDKKYEIDPDIISQEIDETSAKAEGLDYIFRTLKVSNTQGAIDRLSKETIEIFEKIKVKNLIDVVILCSREKNELIPLLARYVAKLNASYQEVGQALTKSLLGSFFFLVKNPASSKSRNRICKFIAELVKFQIISQNQIYLCLRATVEYFCPQNINAYNILIENCGRFLYSHAENHIRLLNLNELMTKKRNAFAPNAEDICSINLEPPKEYRFSEMPPQFRFITSRFYEERDFNALLLTFRKIDWSSMDVLEFSKLCLDSLCSDTLATEKLARLISSLSRIQKEFTIAFVDYIIEILLQSLDSLSTSSNRKIENATFLLSYLFVYGFLESDQLISLILMVSSEISVPQQSARRMRILSNVHKICWRYLQANDRKLILNLVYKKIMPLSFMSCESLADISESSIQYFADIIQNEGSKDTTITLDKDHDHIRENILEDLDDALLNSLAIDSALGSDKRIDYCGLLKIGREKTGPGLVLKKKNKTIIKPI